MDPSGGAMDPSGGAMDPSGGWRTKKNGAQKQRGYRHDDEGEEGAGEDDEAWVAHGHDGGDEEGLVAQFRDDDHRQRRHEAVHGRRTAGRARRRGRTH